jgi:hypothetical protein
MPERHDGEHTPKEYVSRSGYTQGIPGYARYEADGKRVFEVAGNPAAPSFEWGCKRPSIFMPRELCRLRLRVEEVRVERLQEISDEDAVAEGIDPQGFAYDESGRRSGAVSFKPIWEDIHGDGSWEENPFVWCVEFSKIDTE